MLWLYLLAVVTVLIIALRRVRRRHTPLDEELYSKRVAIDHVHSGVASVDREGRVRSLNPAFATTLRLTPEKKVGQDWREIFADDASERIEEAYRQMLLVGTAGFEANAVRADGTRAWLKVSLVAVHDRKARLAGHHCIIEDRTRELELGEHVRILTESLAAPPSVSPVVPASEPAPATARTQSAHRPESVVRIL